MITPKYKPPREINTWVQVGEEQYDNVTCEIDLDDDRVVLCAAISWPVDLMEYMNDDEIAEVEDRLTDEVHIAAREFQEEYGDWLYQCHKEEAWQ